MPLLENFAYCELQEKKIRGFIANALSRFLMIDSKGFRIHINKDDFLKSMNYIFSECYFEYFKNQEGYYTPSYFVKKLQHQINIAFEYPEETYKIMMNEAKCEYEKNK